MPFHGCVVCFVWLQDLIVFIWNILHHLSDGAVEDAAQVIDGGAVHRLVFSQLVDGGAGNVVIFDQRVGGFLGIPKRLPKRSLQDQQNPPKHNARARQFLQK
jgi:hypothetical protein